MNIYKDINITILKFSLDDYLNRYMRNYTGFDDMQFIIKNTHNLDELINIIKEQPFDLTKLDQIYFKMCKHRICFKELI